MIFRQMIWVSSCIMLLSVAWAGLSHPRTENQVSLRACCVLARTSLMNGPLSGAIGATDEIKVACVGDSITFGYGITDRENNSYPSALQRMLGDAYEVRNFGFNGATLLKNGHKPYWQKAPYKDSLEFEPDIVVINLGANDAIDKNWKHSRDFKADYISLIESYRNLDSNPKIYLCEILPIFSNHGRYEECVKNRKSMKGMIREVAASEVIELVNLHAPFADRNDLFSDGLHPNEDGALMMANHVFASLTGNEPPNIEVVKRQKFDDENGTSFENEKAGEFTELETNVGVWNEIQGKVLVDDQHSKSGEQCLQIAGGEISSVVLAVSDDITADGHLSFWAERWTSRAPFRFRIEKQNGDQWMEIYNGDDQIKVGRAFLSHVKIPLGKIQASKLRFSVTSPANTGILIDDLRIAPAEPMRIDSVKVVPLALPALKGAEQSAIVKLKIKTRGTLEPIAISEINASLAGKSTGASINNFQPFFSGNDSDFRWDVPFGNSSKPQQGSSQTFSGNQTLSEGDNYIWLACELNENANIDETIAAQFDSIRFSNGKIKRIEDEPSVQRIGIAVRKGGDDGVHTYRIPGLATTDDGTLIGVYDIRHDGSGDLPGNIDVGMSRSTDGGRTWEPMKVIMDMGDDRQWRGDGIGDPAVMVDRTTGTIWVAATWSHGNRSWVGSGPGLEPQETGQWMMVKSEDDGLTWSEPINITNQVKKPEWCFLLQGPGKGITMSDGTLVFPAQYQDPPNKSDKTANRLPHSTFIYSRDQGRTWKIATGAWDDTTESQIVELADGELMLNCRNNRAAKRAILTTKDMGETWQQHSTHVKELIEPGSCMASLINVGRELKWRGLGADLDERFLLFANPDSLRGRNHMTIKASQDSGTSWPAKHHLLIDEQGGRGYSCMTMIDEETVGILYEGSQADMTFQRIKIKDILNPPQDQKTRNPAQIGKKDGKTSRKLKVFLLTGQSNSLGTTANPNNQDTSPNKSSFDAQVKFFYSNRNTRPDGSGRIVIGQSEEVSSLEVQEGYGDNLTFWGPEFGFGREMAKRGYSEIMIVKASRAGGGNSFWSKDASDNHMYQHVVKTTMRALAKIPPEQNYEIVGLLYLQGESDSEAEAKAAGERLSQLLKNLRSDLPNASEMKLVVGGIAASGRNLDTVRAKQSALARFNPDIEYVDNTDLRSQLYDGLHFDKSAKLEIGRRLADGFLAVGSHAGNPNRSGPLSIARVFGDKMVLQARETIRIWGKAKPLTQVTVQFLGQSGSVSSGKDGSWLVELPPVENYVAAGQELEVTSESNCITLQDVLVGEVWFCAGQSNMEWPLSKTENGKAALGSAADNQLRLLNFLGAASGSGETYSGDQFASFVPANFSGGEWAVSSRASAKDFSGVGYFFARQIRDELDCPVGLINVAIGGTPIESWISSRQLAQHPTLKKMLDGNWLDNPTLEAWCQQRARMNLERGLTGELDWPGDKFGPNHSFKPGFMHTASVAPFQPMSIRGVIWYQGESNALTRKRVEQYPAAFQLLVASWRQEFQNTELAFGFVQLPGMGRSHWPLFREQQRRCLDEISNVGMAIAVDTGHPTNVHPRRKKPIGERLGTWALGEVYQVKSHKTYSGPLFETVKGQKGSLIVSFRQVGEGLRSSDETPLRHFEVCGDDGVFHPATATIVGESTVLISSPEVASPIRVRYAWAPYPDPPVNLFNSADLPASPFSTETHEELLANGELAPNR